MRNNEFQELVFSEGTLIIQSALLVICKVMKITEFNVANRMLICVYTEMQNGTEQLFASPGNTNLQHCRQGLA